MVRLYASGYAWRSMRDRIATASSNNMRILNVLRTFGAQAILRRLRGISAQLRADKTFRAFHEGAAVRLPDFYRQQYVARLGRYAGLLSEAEMTPEPELSTSSAATSALAITRSQCSAAERSALRPGAFLSRDATTISENR